MQVTYISLTSSKSLLENIIRTSLDEGFKTQAIQRYKYAGLLNLPMACMLTQLHYLSTFNLHTKQVDLNYIKCFHNKS